jgi:lactose/L-arabinose transport system ATP-binding protein
VLGLAAGQAVDVGLRPQHLTLDASAQSHRVELTEALGGVAYVHVTAPSGERVVVETREGPLPGLGSRVGLSAAGSGALLFDTADGTRPR